MKRTITILMAVAILAGGISSVAFGHRVEERPVVIQERRIEPLDIENDINDRRPKPLPVRKERPMQGSEVRIRIESVQDARNLRLQEARERGIANQEIVTRVREIQAEGLREREEIFNTRVREIANEARRERVKRLAENINRRNENLSARYNGFLNAIELVLDKIEIRTGIIEENTEADLSVVYSMIDDSRDAITDARNRTLEQRSKIYVVDFHSEDTMKEDFRAIVQEMRDDHNALRTQAIYPLRTMVRNIIVAVREALGSERIITID